MPYVPKDDRPVRLRRAPRGPNLGPLYLFVLVIGGAIAVAGWKNTANRSQAVSEEEPRRPSDPSDPDFDPFANVPKETPPGGEQRFKPTWKAPTGIEAEPQWMDAVTLAEKGMELVEKAKAAKAENKQRTFNEKGKAAKEALNKALEMTAEWELDLIAKYGDNDPRVRRIMRRRNEWFDLVLAFHKTTSR